MKGAEELKKRFENRKASGKNVNVKNKQAEVEKTPSYNKNDYEQKKPKRIKKDIFGKYIGVVSAGRKEAKATIWVKKGSGKITVNGRSLEHYFARPDLLMVINQPFDLTKLENVYDFKVKVIGGGIKGQAEALRLAISWFLAEQDEEEGDGSIKKLLKNNGLLKRDPRVVESKKYGRHKARRSTQWSKR